MDILLIIAGICVFLILFPYILAGFIVLLATTLTPLAFVVTALFDRYERFKRERRRKDDERKAQKYGLKNGYAYRSAVTQSKKQGISLQEQISRQISRQRKL